MASLLASAEEAKHTLTARPKTTLTVRLGGHTLELNITREQFEELTEDLLERTSYTTRQVLAAASLSWSQVNRILLVGGSTRMPMVPRMLEQLSGQKPDHTVHPDEAVARGAAVFAGYLLRRRDPNAKQTFKVVDVNAHSLGIEGIDQRTMRKENIVLIPRNSPLPAKVTEKFVTKTEDQISIVVSVLEGESKVPSQCSMIGRAVLRNLPEHLPKGWPVEVTYEYLTNGRLDVQAKIPGTIRGVELELQREQSLTSERIGRWKKIVEEAATKGFDAFDEMLEDVALARRVEKRKEAISGGPTAPRATSAMASGASISNSPSSSDDLPAPNQDLSGASRAFQEFAESDEEKASTGKSSAPATKSAAVANVASEEPKDNQGPPPTRISKKPMTLAEAQAAKAAASARGDSESLKVAAASIDTLSSNAKKSSGSLLARAGFSETGQRRAPRRLSPTVLWLMSAIALVVVSAASLLICYYVLAWFGKKGNFLNLPLPGLPPAKAAHAMLWQAARSLLHWC